MTLATLALITAVALLGPMLAWSDKLRIPIVVGELVAGVVVGVGGVGWVNPHDPIFTFLANIGFAMMMFVAGSHVPVRNKDLLNDMKPAALRLVCVAAAAGALGWGVASSFHTGHTLLYTVLFASSSAAVVMPIIDSLQLGGPDIIRALPQVALADTLCIVALPLAMDPNHAGRAALGVLVLLACSAVVFALLWLSEKHGWQPKAHEKSITRGFALELRVSLLILLLMAALAQTSKVSIMLAGFGIGLAVAAVGEPHRLASQLFGLSEGMFSPIYFVWLGASINLRDLPKHPAMIVLGLVLAAAALAAHLVARAFGLPVSVSVLAAAQLGVPAAAVTLGTQLDTLKPGEGAALLLGALLTIAAATVAGRFVHEPKNLAPSPSADAPAVGR